MGRLLKLVAVFPITTNIGCYLAVLREPSTNAICRIIDTYKTDTYIKQPSYYIIGQPEKFFAHSVLTLAAQLILFLTTAVETSLFQSGIIE